LEKCHTDIACYRWHYMGDDGWHNETHLWDGGQLWVEWSSQTRRLRRLVEMVGRVYSLDLAQQLGSISVVAGNVNW